jgi:DNA helicase-2/ATP-dependent DNA helicase PcrA
VHLLKADNRENMPNRIDIPIDNNSINAAVSNVEWAVSRILEGEYPMRPSASKCSECDFIKICAKRREEFVSTEIPEPIRIPLINGTEEINVRCFSDVD